MLFRVFAAALAVTGLVQSANAYCFDLEKQLPPGPYQGGSYQAGKFGQINVRPTYFYWAGSPPQQNFTSAEMVQIQCHGANRALNMNNANLLIHFSLQNEDASVFQVNFCDLGGHENVGTGLLPIGHIGEISSVPGMLAAPQGKMAHFNYTTFVGIGNGEGQLNLKANGDRDQFLEIGGQEFFVTSICIK